MLELGLPLDAIARVLDGTVDRVGVLREHRTRCSPSCDRLASPTPSAGPSTREEEGPNGPQKLFDGFDPEAEAVRGRPRGPLRPAGQDPSTSRGDASGG